MYDQSWSDAELQACVDIYADVARRGGMKKRIAKDVFINRAKRAVPGRTEASLQFRMCNISSVLAAEGASYVLGWEPMANVGAAMVPRIRLC
jgi:hypothetical protein